MSGNGFPTRIVCRLVLACATRQHDELLEFMFNRQGFMSAEHNATLAMTHEEWASVGEQRTAVADRQNSIGVFRAGLSSVQQKTCKRAAHHDWRSVTRAGRGRRGASYMCHGHSRRKPRGFHVDLSRNLVRADIRRLEDMRTELDDNGTEIMMLAGVIVALSNSVC